MLTFIILSVLAVLSVVALAHANALQAIEATREYRAYSFTEKLAPCTKEDYHDAAISE